MMVEVMYIQRRGAGRTRKVPVVLSDHAKKRLKQSRQEGITQKDVARAVTIMPFYCPTAYRIRNVRAESGALFDLVIRDDPAKRVIVTIVGKVG